MRDRNGEVSREIKDRLAEGMGDDEVCEVAGGLMLWKLFVARGQMGDGSYAKSLALTWVGLEKPCIRQDMPVVPNYFRNYSSTIMNNLVMHCRRITIVDDSTCLLA